MDEHVSTWMSMPGVEAVGLGDGCIIIYFAGETEITNSSIPEKLAGIQIVKKVSGEFEAQQNC